MFLAFFIGIPSIMGLVALYFAIIGWTPLYGIAYFFLGFPPVIFFDRMKESRHGEGIDPDGMTAIHFVWPIAFIAALDLWLRFGPLPPQVQNTCNVYDPMPELPRIEITIDEFKAGLGEDIVIKARFDSEGKFLL
jgi:hypothetical protein